MSDHDADKRTSAVKAVNEALGNVEAAEQRLARAKSEFGTAKADLQRRCKEYAEARNRLLKLLPQPSSASDDGAASVENPAQ